MRRGAIALLVTVGLSLALGSASAEAADTCPNAAYRTGTGANLPDCRAWEQVSPADKAGDQVNPTFVAYPSPDGNNAIIYSSGSLNATDGNSYKNPFSSVRGSSQWTTFGLNGPIDSLASGQFINATVLTISDDRTKALVVSLRKLTPGAVEGDSNLYIRSAIDGSYSLAAHVAGRQFYDSSSAIFAEGLVFGNNPSFDRIGLFTSVPLIAGAPDGLNLYIVGGGRITMANKNENGPPVSAYTGPFPGSGGQLISDDGRRVTFPDLHGLYQRVDDSELALISRSHRTGMGDDPNAPVPVRVDGFGVWPTRDGSQVTFGTDNGNPTPTNFNLTDDGPPSSFYRWRADGDQLTNLLAGVPLPWNDSAGYFVLLRVSSDQRYVWFTYQDLDANSSGRGHLAVLDTQERRADILASAPSDVSTPIFSSASARFSPDGTKLVAATQGAISSYSQANAACLGGSCSEAYYFDAERPSSSPDCVSCGPAGTHSAGDVGLGTQFQSFFPLAKTVTDDGRAIFDTPQPLVAADVNTVADAYEFTPGQGSKLLSSGTGRYPNYALAATPSGNDMLFYSRDTLVPQDADDAIDVYDARMNGGLAAQQVAPSTGGSSCPTGSCPGSQPVAPAAESPGTQSFQGPARPPAFRVSSVSASARRAAVASGRLKVSVKVGAAGRLSARAAARTGRSSVTVGRTSRSVGKGGTYALTLTLSRAARRTLARTGKLAMSLSVSYSRASKASNQSFTLSAPRARRSSGGGAR